ncbi:uncharacterized protein AB675_10441 [Cyphellophora attinorum]|uniref:Uncharacterized protein n=1 Tax=Cyphellophora attinorum TaxID=1664694 RepID=A0A0N1GYN0_9EURO|nr:uncharacterized protein AB675_10441 [Phialophora attinorum]KPI35935.1 hypothetical protein AB675_10441 [Phialophora attinorum]
MARFLWKFMLVSLIKQVKQMQLMVSDDQMSHILAVLEQQVLIVQSHADIVPQAGVGEPQACTAPVGAEAGPRRPYQDAISSDLNNVLDTIDRAVGNSSAVPARTTEHEDPLPTDTPWLGSIGDESSAGANIDDLFAMDAVNWDSSWEESFAGLGVPIGTAGTQEVYYDFSGAAT